MVCDKVIGVLKGSPPSTGRAIRYGILRTSRKQFWLIGPIPIKGTPATLARI
jgi:hypothetical protein